ncbi:hypothetical protein RISK_001258 [Rhodopirellula islandica]|uniref:Secreted protein n=1 Tax=Rhodopirellula islandica TaxID=595434 RepID=A0A0J1EMD4_RHOIS|nr:carboxypeptidase-like regulatory domain-containing protein [Rhodopirellula islandica]KLU06694.1 hypothetical protein RISK_001258 [Rhodopirellula islandica]
MTRPWVSALFLPLLLAGCSAQHPATGFVGYTDGEPVQSGSIEFRLIETGDRFAGRIARDGEFTLRDQDGNESLPPGDYEVVVVQIVLTEDVAAADHDHGRTVPRRYADYYTSGLRYSNPADRVDSIRVELEATPSTQSSAF